MEHLREQWRRIAAGDAQIEAWKADGYELARGGWASSVSAVARVGGRAIGFLYADTVDRTGTIEKVWVDPDYRRQGIATKMLRAAEREVGFKLSHSSELSASGAPWASSISGETLRPSYRGDGEFGYYLDQFDRESPSKRRSASKKAASLKEGAEDWFGSYHLVYTTKDEGETKPRHLITAYEGSTPVATMEWYGRTGEVRGIEVEPEHRRKGLATAMWEFAQDAPKKPQHSNQRTDDGEAWARSTGDRMPRRTHAALALSSGTYWRMHPVGRPFDITDAKSTDFGPAPQTRTGYSCVANPWHLFVYSEVMGWFEFRGGRSVTSESDVIAFTGHEMSRRGADGEPLVKPDSVVDRYSWEQFIPELLSTPFGQFWAPRSKRLHSWEDFAQDRPPGAWIGSSPRAVLTKAVLAQFAPGKLAQEQEWVK